MSDRSIRDFLSSRRARITPEQAGLPAYGNRRRVAGLRREEVALLAGVSVDYYVRLERGKYLGGASDSVLDAVARALQLDEAEREHLFNLARTTGASAADRRDAPLPQVRGPVQQILDAMTEAPAWVRNDRHDILATNRLGLALGGPLFADRSGRPNIARFVYLDPAAQGFFRDWDDAADHITASLQHEAGRTPDDPELAELVGELSARSEAFRRRWATHNVGFHRTGAKRLNHPVVGELDLVFETLDLPSDPGLSMTVHTAEAGTPTADALRLLADWADTEEANATGSGSAARAAAPTPLRA
ncbi:helix-turn-helix domain-containing protein [Prauserella cavernicola]|uniref:Helix-turn-helix domain-containing protein n=1 Tax=Prauserella cavernicola TaxID=2800127 RepID=A0A934QXL4_9PSEU|nr:helix-turn-helix transcriptional regulator [Prauserella cavernicola]MBK1787148.1 helix-turn-helix domain-containing protein [Prauserella cavernicola]